MRARVLLQLVAALTVLALAPDAAATTQRTFVSSNGSDTAACSIAQPCRSFNKAIAQTNAGGEIVVLDSAGYGAVTVAKAVSIIAPAGIYAGISVFSGAGVTIDAPGSIVVLRGLVINGQGGSVGVNITHAARVLVDRCEVSNMGADGIAVATATALTVVDSTLRDGGASGIDIAAGVTAVLEHVRSMHNQAHGVHIAPGSVAARVAVTDSVISDNGGSGIDISPVDATQLTVHVERSTFAGNTVAGFGVNSTTGDSTTSVALAHNAFSRNGSFGVSLFAPTAPAFIEATMTDNTIDENSDAIYVYGSVSLYANANSVARGFVGQVSGAFFGSYGNNVGNFPYSGTITPVTGR